MLRKCHENLIKSREMSFRKRLSVILMNGNKRKVEKLYKYIIYINKLAKKQEKQAKIANIIQNFLAKRKEKNQILESRDRYT